MIPFRARHFWEIRHQYAVLVLMCFCVLGFARLGMGADSVSKLIGKLKDKHGDSRQSAVDELGRIKDPRVVEPLIVTLKDGDAGVRLHAADALGQIKDPRAVEPLIAALKDTDSHVRFSAAAALVKIAAPAVEPLVAALKDPDSNVRVLAADALGEIKDLRAVEPLVAALKDSDSNVRRMAASWLGKIKDPRAVEPLIAALKDTDSHVRFSAAAALVKTGVPAVEPLIEAMRPLVAAPNSPANINNLKMVEAGLVRIGTPAVEPLIAALKDPDSNVRVMAADALGKIKDPRAVEPLIAALKDSDSNVRQMAARTLGEIKDPRSVESLIAAAQTSPANTIGANNPIPSVPGVVVVESNKLRFINSLGSDIVFLTSREHPITRLADITDSGSQFAAWGPGPGASIQDLQQLKVMISGGSGGLHMIGAGNFGRLFQDNPELKLFVTFRGVGGVEAIEISGGGMRVRFAEQAPTKLTVNTIAVSTKFLAYFGGGTNISPPDTIGSGDGIPLISISNGASFLAGEVSSKDEKAKLIKITFAVTNPAQEATSFKIGDVQLVIGSDRLNDFVAVGYDSKLCAMSDADRKAVKEIVVTIPPTGTRRLSFAFPLFNPDSKRGELVLGSLSPVPFEIGLSGK
jgi:HEAT repeat protein